ncbi:MAG: DUF4386 family protein [Anaerolineales bacterium]|nr:DUF4386 family protein [Anaerolineales bacterium]
MAEGTIIALNELNNLVLLDVSQKFSSATGAQAVALESLGRILISTEQWGNKIRLAFFVIDSLLYAILFVTSGAGPLALGWSGVIADILAAGGFILFLASMHLAKLIGRAHGSLAKTLLVGAR